MSQPANYVTCRCQYCDKGIEFDAAELVEDNSIIPCPHCGLETKLSIPQEMAPDNTVESSLDLRRLEAQKNEISNRMMIRFKQDTLELCDDIVLITRRGLLNALNAGMNGTRTIQISSLIAVQMKPGSGFTGGYILFSYAGSKPFMGGLLDAIHDPDAFLFSMELNGQIAEFKAKVETRMRAIKQPAPANNSAGMLADEIRKLAELKQQGLLSQEEFDAAKKKLLS
jgi:hypothetical protein